MPYSSTEVLKQFVKGVGDGGAGNKCKNISEIYTYLNGMQIRDVLKLNSGNTDISNGQRVIDVIAIGMDKNSLPSGRKLDPVVISLDYYKFNSLKLKADTTIAETSNDYYGNHQPMYMNFNRSLKLPGTQIKFSELTSCNSYLSNSRGLSYCGPVSWANVSQKDTDYWNDIEKNLSNYANNSANYDANGMSELTALFYTTDLIDHLQIRLGYRMPDQNDMYHWSNWLVASDDGNGGTNSRYYKLMYLTEFDYYMHGGAVANPSRLDGFLCASVQFSEMIAQILDPASQKVDVKNDMQYYCTNTLTKGSILPAGQFIYSKDYKFKLHLTHGGNLNVWEFPITGDDVYACKAKMLVPKNWAIRPDVTPMCYLAIQPDGNMVVAGNPKNGGMYGDINYKSTLDSFGDYSVPPSFTKSCPNAVSNPTYIFQCVNENGGINTYPIIKDEYWTNNNGSGYMRDLNENGANGRLYENYGDTENDSRNTIFRCSTNKNGDNSYGTGGKNTWQAVINLKAPAGYTKEPMYLWRNQFGAERKLLYAVFKKNPPTFKSDDIRNRAIIITSNFRNSLTPKNTKDFSGLSDRQLYAILNCTTNRKAVELINSYTGSNNSDYSNGGQQYLPLDILSASNTNGNVYFAMNDYRVIVNNGGTIMAVNAGKPDKVGADQVGYISGSGASQWKYTDDKYDTECIHGWKYINTDGNGVVDLKQIVDITKQGDSKNWCYRNPFLTYTDSDGTMYKFGATNMQQVLWIVGDYQNNIDTIYAFLTSDFMTKAKANGYKNANDTNDVNDMNSTNGQFIATNYCMRGNRWITDANCKTRALTSQNSKLSAGLKRVIDFDIKTRICANPSNTPERNLCAVVKPTGLSDVETSLLALDPNFAYAFDGVATGTKGSINPTGAYGITETDAIKSIDTLFNTIRDTIAKNANSLTEAQLLYLRKFYTTSNPALDGQLYDNIRTFAHKTDYLSGENALRFSPDGKYLLVFQSDGNLVAKQNIAGQPLTGWSSGTSGKPNATLAIQSDGNVVIYQNGGPIWATGTSGSTDPTVLTIDNNGIVVVLRYNGSWNPIWTSNDIKNYKTFTGAIVINTGNRIDKSNWFPMYQRAAKLDTFVTRTDITYPSPPPMGFIYYRNSNGIIIGWLPAFDTNILKAKGTPLAKDPNTFSADSNLWKYFVGTLDINFPKQLTPLTHKELVDSRDPKDIILPLITSASSPYEKQSWTMDGTSPGNVLVYRLIDDAALINYNRELKRTLADTDFKAMCGKNLNSCYNEYLGLVSSDVTSAYPNAVCDVAMIGSGATIMKTDPNYDAIIKAYTASAGFGNNRNTANVIVGNFMSKSGIAGNPSSFTDSQIYAILIGSSNPSGELNGLSGLFSASNATAIAAKCNTTYAVATCSAGKSRYPAKSTFNNRERFIGGGKFNSRVELFSGSNCLDICNDPKAPQNIQDACKTGAIDYCNKGENIFGPDCTKDLTLDPVTNAIKYPELVDIKNKWCDSNKTHPNYLKHGCPPLSGSNLAAGDPNQSGSDQPFTKTDDKGLSGGMIGLIISICLIFLAAIVGVVYNKRKAASANKRMPPMMPTGPPIPKESLITTPPPITSSPSMSTPATTSLSISTPPTSSPSISIPSATNGPSISTLPSMSTTPATSGPSISTPPVTSGPSSASSPTMPVSK